MSREVHVRSCEGVGVRLPCATRLLILDVETGDYEIDAEDVQALQRAKAKHPDGAFYIVRIGAPTAYRLGAHPLTPAR